IVIVGFQSQQHKGDAEKGVGLMGKMNMQWHHDHRMPDNPSKQQRAEWHYQHALNCGCRTLTPSITSLLVSQGYEVPRQARLP
ncbi:MAG: hypothetical protein JWQ89_444, partial [Devosia sp.]|uniref:hypothetical protein n=1 Tax=Devosia sp. TaxID=1871048 RepID=UPI002634C5CD